MQDKDQIRNNRIDHIYKLVDATTKSLEKIKDMLKNLDKDDQRKTYEDVEGVTGTFDGLNLIASDGKKYEIPANYAAKSRLVVGDTLKMVEDEGKQVFKQIDKVERKKVEGIMNKKEGKWYIISDSGTYKVSDIAADFQHAQLHDEASAFVPAGNLNVGFASLDVIKNKSAAKVYTPAGPSSTSAVVGSQTVAAKPVAVKPVVKPMVQNQQAAPVKRPLPVKSPVKPRAMPQQSGFSKPSTGARTPGFTSKPKYPAPKTSKEFVEDIVRPNEPVQATSAGLEDDDLR